VAEHRRLGRVDRQGAKLSPTHPVEHVNQPVQVHRFVQTIRDGFVHQRMIRDLRLRRQILWTRGLIRKNRGEKIVGTHALQRSRHFSAALESGNSQRAPGVPFPAHAEHRRGQ
jgi:hypothetical protein